MFKKFHTNWNRFSRIFAAVVVSIASSTAYFTSSVYAATPDLTSAKVSFTFDDGLTSAYTQAAPTLAKYGLTGTNYVITGCVGKTSVPNSCHADGDASYMTWTQIKALKNTYGWEIGSHSATHPYMATYAADDGQSRALTQTQVSDELSKSKSALAAQGINATAFSTPYGDFNNYTLQTVAKYYTSHRGFANQHDNVYPYNDMLLNNMQVQVPVSVASVKSKIDYAIANDRWLILTLHDVKPTPSTDPYDYQYATRDLDAIAAYVKAKQDAGLIKNVNITNGLAKGTNLLTNGSFKSGISNGWKTDNTTAFRSDSGNNGSLPDSAQSVKVGSTSTSAHLYSPRVAVDSRDKYAIKSFLNVQAIKAVSYFNTKPGEIGYYIDEYDALGNWISGQYKVRETTKFVESINLSYQPTSPRVKTASLQIYTVANSGITAYIDSFEWFYAGPAVSSAQNLMPGGAFDGGLTQGWRTDASTVTHDSQSRGAPANNGNSLAIKTGTGTNHIFSPLISVDATRSYHVDNYLNVVENSGSSIGFYIDEYDANGHWVSGQYRATVTSLGARDIGITYKPTSSAVKQSRLQVIIKNGTTLNAYFDDSRWFLI